MSGPNRVEKIRRRMSLQPSYVPTLEEIAVAILETLEEIRDALQPAPSPTLAKSNQEEAP